MSAIVRLLGLDFADVDAPRAAELLARRPASDPFGYVVTPNADHLVRLHKHPELAPLYQGAMLRLLDSRVVAVASRVIGLPAPCVAPGSDLTAMLLRNHVSGRERVTIVGLSAQWLPALMQRTGITDPAHCDPPVGFDLDPHTMREAVDFVLAHPARFVFLAVGSPQQEVLAAAIAATGRATGIGLCIGASLEFLAGAANRAPRWMQSAGLEWLYRLGGSPRRLARRYLLDSPAVFGMLVRARLGSAGDF